MNDVAVKVGFELIKLFLDNCRPEPPNEFSDRKQSGYGLLSSTATDLLLQRVQRVIEIMASIPEDDHIVSPLEA